MPTVRGKDIRVRIGDGELVPSYDPIGGEVTVQWGDSSAEFDTSSKDDGEFNLVSYAGRALRFTMNGKVKLPDAGYERLLAVRNASPPEEMLQITKGGIVVYEGLCGWGSNDTDHTNNQASTWSSGAAPAAVPTINNLAALV